MNLYKTIAKILSNIISKKTKNEKIYPLLQYSGINDDFDAYIGTRMILILILSIIGFILPITLFKTLGLYLDGNIIITLAEYSFGINWLIMSILLSILFFIISFAIYSMRINYIIQLRAKLVEDNLPDFLYLVSDNLSAGMTTFSAVSNSARKEFGLLGEEIKIALGKSTGSESFTEALKELKTRIDSEMLKETISFFVESMKSGGKLAKLLENTAQDLKQRQELKKELKSSTKMYVMFVLFIILIATPLLLSIAVQFLSTIENLQGDTSNIQSNSQVSFLGGKLLISPEFMTIVAYILIFINSFLASLFMGILSEAKMTQGIKYFPILLIVTLVLFTLGNIILPKMLGALG